MNDDDPVKRWRCPNCGRTEEWSYEDLAEYGTPICWNCDEDMYLE